MIFKGFQNGINLGGWISQFDKYDKAHFDSFITEKDIAYIASLGYDHVRVPVDYNVLEDEEGNIIPSGFGYLENCRSWCEKHHLNMLIDLHECYGYSFDPLKKDMDRKKFFYDDALQERFLHLWSEIATRFKDYPDQVAFEPLNEVVLEEVADAWNAVIAKYVTLMRSIVPEAYLVIGGVCYNNVLSVPLIKRIDTGQVHDGDVLVSLQLAFLFLHRNTGPVTDELVRTGQGVKQRRFAAVRVARQGNFQLSLHVFSPFFQILHRLGPTN